MKDRSLLYAILGFSMVIIPWVHSKHWASRMAPVDLKFVATDGTKVDLAGMRGKVVLIDFWATWCGPCRQEAPDVVATYNALHDKGFEVVGISLDLDRNALDSVTREQGMVWPQYFDGKGWSNDIAASFGIHSIPAMWILDKNGKLADSNGREDLRGKVEKLLAQ